MSKKRHNNPPVEVPGPNKPYPEITPDTEEPLFPNLDPEIVPDEPNEDPSPPELPVPPTN